MGLLQADSQQVSIPFGLLISPDSAAHFAVSSDAVGEKGGPFPLLS